MDPLDPHGAALLTDLYEVTMAAAYWEHGLNPSATFELFFRHLPPGRGYVVSAGLEHALDYLTGFHFEQDQIVWLNRLFVFHNVRAEFWDYLRALRFTGDVWAPPEGTPVFAGEPVLRVTAPLVEAQLVETYLISILAYPSLVATEASRFVEAARGRPVIDFGARRAQVPMAAPVAARAAYNWRSAFLITPRDDIFPFSPIWQEAGGQLDASIFFSVTENVKLGVQGVNLLDEITTTSQVVDFSGTRFTRSAFRNDRRYTFIARFDF